MGSREEKCMNHFEYVPKKEWAPIKNELFEIIRKLQDKVKDKFTFKFCFVGSSKQKMITCDRNSNVGFDFDVNIEVNDPDEDYSAKEIRDFLRDGLDTVMNPRDRTIFGYDYTEDSTRVLTIKVKDSKNSRILHSCDFCIVNNCANGRQQYIRYNKQQNNYSWEFQSKGYDNLPEKIEWIKKNGLWQEVRDIYLAKKNTNTDDNKKSRAISAETIHQVCQQNGFFDE